MGARWPTEDIAERLIHHYQVRPPYGDCSCGHVVPLGHSFAEHQASAILAALAPHVARREREAAAEALREFARRQDTWCEAGRAEQVISRAAMRDALERAALDREVKP